MILLSGTLLLLTTTMPEINVHDLNRFNNDRIILTEYNSPTLSMDPFKNKQDQEYQKIMDQILLQQIQKELLR